MKKIFVILSLFVGLLGYGQRPLPDCSLFLQDIGDFESSELSNVIVPTILRTYSFKTREMPSIDINPFCSFRLGEGDLMYDDDIVLNYSIPINDLTEKVSIAKNFLFIDPLTGTETILARREPILNDYGIPTNAVYNGMQSIRLNNAGHTGNGTVTSLERSCAFVPTDDVLTYNFRLIMENGHDTPSTLDKQPTFTVNILNEDEEIISQSCIIATLDDPIFQLAQKQGKKDLVYTDWLCGAIKIPHDYVTEEKKITYEFIISDCRETYHFAVAYLDDIKIGMECEPDFGWLDLDLDDVFLDCPTDVFQVCGSYIAPQNANLTDIKLDIIDVNTNASVLTSLIDNATINSGSQTFCFSVDLPSLGITTGEYKFRASAEFTTTITGSNYVYELEAESSNQVDLSTLECCENNNFAFEYDIENYILTWDDFGGPYNVEVSTDNVCCGGTGSGSNGLSMSFTTDDNFFNINSVTNQIKDRCYRWRIETPCGWSDWCCITTAYPDGGLSLNIPCIEEYDNSLALSVYPNPTTGILNISGVQSGATFEIYDYEMNRVHEGIYNQDAIDVSHLPKGSYVLIVNNDHRINLIKL